MKNIFVGNLSFAAVEPDLQKLFEEFGTVAGVLIVKNDKVKSRGYGFVDMPDEAQAKAAIAALEGREFMGRPLSVSPVVPKVKKPAKTKKKWGNVIGKPHTGASDAPKTRPYERSEKRYEPRTHRPDDRAPRRKFEGRPSKFDGKSERGARPYSQDDRGSKFRGQREDGPRPYRKEDGASKPWDKNKGVSKPYSKFARPPEGRTERSFKPNSRSDRDQARAREDEGETKPFRKEKFSSKPWLKMKSATAKPISKPFSKPVSPAYKARRTDVPKPRPKHS